VAFGLKFLGACRNNRRNFKSATLGAETPRTTQYVSDFVFMKQGPADDLPVPGPAQIKVF
jgi:hypothetical protein